MLPHSCSKCPSRWGGANTAHCSVCHLTFTGITAFEKHRTGSYGGAGRTCLTPAKAGLVLTGRSYPCYGEPDDLLTMENSTDDE